MSKTAAGRSDVARGPTVPRVSGLLAYNSAHFGSRTAVRIDGDGGVSHAELARRVAEAAAVLGQHVRPGERVAIWMHNCHAWVTAFLALNALGAVCVPVNTRLTPAELSVILLDAEVSALIATAHYRGRHYLEEALTGLPAHPPGMRVIGASDAQPAAD